MVPENDPGPFPTLESLFTTIEITHQSWTIRRGESWFPALADRIDPGASAADGPALLLLTRKRIYLVMPDGRAVQHEWADVIGPKSISDHVDDDDAAYIV